MLMRLWREDEGILTFEWILLLTLLVIGVIGGIAAIRDAIMVECLNVAGAIASVNQSYQVSPGFGGSISATVSDSTVGGVAGGGTSMGPSCSGAQGFSYAGLATMDTYLQSTTTTVVNGNTNNCGL